MATMLPTPLADRLGYDPHAPGTVEWRLIDRGWCCVRCGCGLGLYPDVSPGEGLVCPAPRGCHGHIGVLAP